MGSLSREKVNVTRLQLRQLGLALNNYQRVCGSYPTEHEGLMALAVKPLSAHCDRWQQQLNLPGPPKDAWGREFLYQSDGKTYLVRSLGKDGKPGGSGVDADLSTDDPNI
jgi:general secretion pathway protein G